MTAVKGSVVKIKGSGSRSEVKVKGSDVKGLEVKVKGQGVKGG
jgi:hypothetical protein